MPSRSRGTFLNALLSPAIPGVRAVAAFPGVPGVREVCRHLGFKRPLNEPLRQLGQQTFLTERLLTLQQTGQEIIDLLLRPLS